MKNLTIHHYRQTVSILTLLIYSLAIFWLSSCVPPAKKGQAISPNIGLGGLSTQKAGYVSIFLNLRKTTEPSRIFDIQSVEILDENNSWIPLLFSTVSVDTRQISDSQLFLGRAIIPIGHYGKLRITTRDNSPSNTSSSMDKPTILEIREPLYMGKGASRSIFIQLDHTISQATGIQNQPRFSLRPKLKNLLANIAYVSCPDIDTIFMICTDKNRVCDSLGVPGGPSYLVSDPIAPTANLFALTERDKSVKKVGPAANRLEARYPLSTLGKNLHFTTDPFSRWAYVIDRQRGNILRLNLRTGAIDLKNHLGYDPSFILYLAKQNLLAVSLSLSQTIILLDPQTLNTVQRISTGRKPAGMMLSRDTLLYIAEEGGNSVMIYDLSRNTIRKRISVGLAPKRIIYGNNHIYVTNTASDSLSVLNSGQLGVAKTIPLQGTPLEIAYSPSDKWIYTGNRENKGLDIIDPVNNNIIGHIPLGAVPKGIAILH
jgi:YVTN family beta-propeller protein